jgi:hypothetical protein
LAAKSASKHTRYTNPIRYLCGCLWAQKNKNLLIGILLGVLGTLAVVFCKSIAGFIKQTAAKAGNTNNNTGDKDE